MERRPHGLPGRPGEGPGHPRAARRPRRGVREARRPGSGRRVPRPRCQAAPAEVSWPTPPHPGPGTPMSTTPTTTAHPPAARVTAWPTGWGAALGAAARLPPLPPPAGPASWLWQRPHYQFFPLILIGAGVLAYTRLRDMPGWRPGTSWVAAVGLGAAWWLLAAAELLAS